MEGFLTFKHQLKFLFCTCSLLLTLGNWSQFYAGEITLKNGTLIKGKPLPMKGISFQAAQANSGGPTEIYPYWMIDDDMRKYFVPKRNVTNIIQGAEPASFEEYFFEQLASGRKFSIERVNGIFNVSSFKETARRTLSLNTAKGKIDVVQGITKLTPETATITSLTHLWEFQLSTSSIPPDDILAILHKQTDPKNTEQRLKLIRFLINASQYQRAQLEIDVMQRDFPDMQDRLKALSLSLRQLQAEQIAGELEMRHRAGQYSLVSKSLQKFPRDDVSASILRKIDDLALNYQAKYDQAEKVRSLLRDYEIHINDEAEKQALSWMQGLLTNELEYDSLERLTFFLRSENDPGYAPREKISLAYSSFILGNENATPDLKQTIRAWETRRWILEYLQTVNANERQLLLAKIKDQEGIGVKSLNALLDHLPPQTPTPGIMQSTRLTLSVPDSTPNITYHVQLPAEYHPTHQYPVLVVLGDSNRKPGDELLWWAGTTDKPGQAQRHGYITIEPEYLATDDKQYHYGESSHQAVINSLVDLSKRFNIDRKRIFIAGHGAGGDAVYDIAFSHPDIFCGAIPIVGILESYPSHYWNNAPFTAWYVIMGEYDRDTVELNATELNKLYKDKTDIITAIYKSRGYEDYYEEIHRLFDWMARIEHRSDRTFNVKSMRTFDNRFYWLEMNEIPPAKIQLAPTGKIIGKGFEVEGKVTLGNTIYVKSPAKQVSINLSPELISFEKRIEIYINGVRKYNDIPEFNLETLLEDRRINGKLYPRYWVKLTF
jgi:predicted esterase